MDNFRETRIESRDNAGSGFMLSTQEQSPNQSARSISGSRPCSCPSVLSA